LRRAAQGGHRADHLEALVAAVRANGPLRRADIAKIPQLHGARPNQLERLIRVAVDAGTLISKGDQLTAVTADEGEDDEGRGRVPRERALRVVAIDFESVVRTTAEHPYVERRAFQVGALRFGRDRAWVHQRRSTSRFCQLPETAAGPAWQITNPAVAARHAAEAVPAAVWLAELDAVLDGADMVVAYNGLELDFPLLDEERTRAGLPPLSGVDLVDGLLLALSVWPNPPNNHRLAHLAARLHIDVERYTWHEALSDCRLLATLVWAAARTVRHVWTPELVDLALTACDDSTTWSLLADLARLRPSGRRPGDGEVAAILGDEFDTDITPRRVPPGMPVPPPAPVAVAAAVVSADGRVDPHLLAEAVRDASLVRRPAQGQMADLVAAWVAAGHGGLIEAPTGTGKSLVLLAAALDWVRGAPERRAVIATHTKQLQAQLAADVQRLVDAGIGALGGGATDLVKGASNRLSVRGLTLALTDACHPGRRRGQLADPGKRELLVYLAVRFATAGRLSERWLARSVDRVDIPIVFDRTSRNLLSAWLASLSQHDQGEYRADADVPLTLHTDRIAEALEASRIVIANHALLLAHRDELGALGDGLIVLVDEAHELEGAATDALSASFDYQALERIPNEVARFTDEAGPHDALRRAVDAAGQLRRFLASEVLPSAALRVLDQLSEADAEPGRRAATIASPYAGLRGSAPIDGLRHSLARVHNYLDFLRRMLAWWAADQDGLDASDRWAAERFRAASSTVVAQQAAIDAVLVDLDLLLGPLRRRAVRTTDSGEDPEPASGDRGHDAALAAALDLNPDDLLRHAPAPPETGPAATDGEVVDLVALEAEADPLGDDGGEFDSDDNAVASGDDDSVPDDGDGDDGTPPPPVLNRTGWIAEADSPDLARSPRRLRFSLTTSPIALGADPTWRGFLADTPRLVLTSGTLRVADAWDFIRTRLGLDAALPAAVLETPFDHATQARLFCLADFPSWAEHPVRAIRTIAHQLGGWMRLAGRPHPDGGVAGGAMVLTTSRAAAAAVAEAAAPALAVDGVPLATTETLGNARAVDRFATAGGVLVGTRGLWQGVDIDDPQRLRMVWINKLPFVPFADPVVAARRAAALDIAVRAGASDPERAADEAYYLPLAALTLRQAVGRLIRSTNHRGVILISDAKLAGADARRRMYRRVFLGSLDAGLRQDVGGDIGAGNVVTMADAWAETIEFAASEGFVDPEAAAALDPRALGAFVDLPEMIAIRAQVIDDAGAAVARANDPVAFAEDIVARCEAIARVLGGPRVTLRPEQRDAIAAVARGDDLMALLPTGFGKSYCYQLPALVLPGVTIIVSPLVSLMVDQAMGLGATIGGMVRALTGPMRESNSRLGKTQVAETLRGEADHGVRLIYLSPERLADARFRDLVARGIEQGIVRRIAIDEAHTLVDWGDDFRPSFRRLDRWLAELRIRHPKLQVSAFTATANRTVREGIRTRVFGLPAAEPPGGDGSGFVTVAANPLRADLAVWRRRLAPGGPNAVAGLVEAVVGALEQHAIFYCTTVREVERVYASLRDYLGEEHADRVLRYHGRLSQAEKAAVAVTFRTAARAGDDDFRPMIVVATSAFGLGVDRDDIRCVFCVSPPTDLAALYQQLGRAGRDSARLIGGIDDVPLNAAMALVTQRSWRTVTWMASQDLGINTLRRLGDRLLAAAPIGGLAALDVDRVAQDQILEDVAAGRLGERAAFSARILDGYRSGVVRALAALNTVGGVEDLGDIPDRVRVAAGEVACDDELWQPIIDALVAMPDAATGGVELVAAHARLAATADGDGDACPDVTDLWIGLAAAHDRGWTDVSQLVARSRLVVFRVLAAARPGGFDGEITNRRTRVAAELAELRGWFEDTRCAHEGFAAHFGVPALPDGACGTAAVRCSAHWNNAATLAADPTPQPALHRAFFTPRPQPVAATAAGRANFERRLRRHIADLLWQEYRGLTAPMLRRVLHGEDSWFSPRLGRRRRLWPSLLYHRSRGAMIGVRLAAVEVALATLVSSGDIVHVGDGRWRWAAHVAADEARAARAVARAATTAGAAGS
jgi:RecQ family ATP-dependent DNA helicase